MNPQNIYVHLRKFGDAKRNVNDEMFQRVQKHRKQNELCLAQCTHNFLVCDKSNLLSLVYICTLFTQMQNIDHTCSEIKIA